MNWLDSPKTAYPRSLDAEQSVVQRWLGQAIDAGLIGVPLLGPWFMGGRHPLGEFVLVALAVTVALSWVLRRALDSRRAAWVSSPGEWVLLAAIALTVAQIVPWPPAVIEVLSPHTRQLLSLWRGDATVAGTLGTWSQVSMTPDWTRAGLTLLLAYGMLFLVAVQRLDSVARVEKLLKWIALSVVVQAVFGIVQYLTANGKYVWIYEHPYRDTYRAVTGAYINKNHFAHLMALGLGPLACLVAGCLSRNRPAARAGFPSRTSSSDQIRLFAWMLALGVVLLAGLLTWSRGGAMAMLVACAVVCAALYRAKLLSWRFPLVLTGIFALIGVSLAIHGYSQVIERLDDYTSGSIEDLDHGGSRRAIWDADFKALPEYLFFGSGVGSHREIYPMYLSDSWEVEFTHAESGYLQIALETGVPGLAILLASIVLCGMWCRRNLAAGSDRRIVLLGAAITAGLLASLAHSLADFVWYIPSLAAITVLLAAAACRLAVLSRASETAQPLPLVPASWAWRLAPLAVLLAGGWMGYDRACAAMAEPYWDNFLRFAATPPAERNPSAEQAAVTSLEDVLCWTPDNARAHVRLASLLLGRFEHMQQAAANAMPLSQISEAAIASRSRFASAAELDAWLSRAIGENRRLLNVALWHLERGVSLCPLLGEGYIHLADLCFLKGQGQPERLAYLNQALKVRPYDGVVLLSAGSGAALRGDVDSMIAYWRPVLHCRDQERQAMVRLLTAMPIPIEEVLSAFQPDLPSIRLFYAHYSKTAPPEQLRTVASYYIKQLTQDIQHSDPDTAAQLWYEMHVIYLDAKQPAAAVTCLRHATAARPTDFDFRFVLGQRLNDQHQFSEAEEQLKWCAQRRPDHLGVKDALAQAVTGRVDEQTRAGATPASHYR